MIFNFKFNSILKACPFVTQTIKNNNRNFTYLVSSFRVGGAQMIHLVIGVGSRLKSVVLQD